MNTKRAIDLSTDDHVRGSLQGWDATRYSVEDIYQDCEGNVVITVVDKMMRSCILPACAPDTRIIRS